LCDTVGILISIDAPNPAMDEKAVRRQEMGTPSIDDASSDHAPSTDATTVDTRAALLAQTPNPRGEINFQTLRTRAAKRRVARKNYVTAVFTNLPPV